MISRAFRMDWTIALRYLAPRRGRGFLGLLSLIAVGGVFVGVTALVVVLAVMSGFEQELRQRIVGAYAHVVVLRRGDEPLRHYREVMARVAEDPGVEALAPFVYTEAILSNGRTHQEGVILRGVDLDLESQVTDIRAHLVDGSLDLDLDGEDRYPGILLGSVLADRLLAFPGDTLVAASLAASRLTPLGYVPKLRRFRVAGIVRTGIYEFDAKLAYIGLEEAQALLGLDGAVTGLSVRVRDAYGAPEVGARLADSLGYPYRTNNWIEMNQSLFSALKLEKVVMFVILTLIILVAAFNIVSTLIMIVKDKAREIGILRSMGLTARRVVRIFVLEGLTIGLVGTALGSMAGLLLAYLLDRYQFISIPGDVYFIDSLPVAMEWLDFALVAAASLAISLTATIYPALRAARLTPVEAIRNE